MLVLDMPLIPAQDTPMVLQTSAGARKSTNTGGDKALFATVGSCSVSPTFEHLEQEKQKEYSVFSEGMPLWPDADAVQLFGDIRMDVRMMEAYDAAQSYILQQPRHGTLEAVKVSGRSDKFKYVPNPGFVGNDRAVFLVNIDGHEIKVIQYIKVVSDPKLTDPESDFGKIYNKYCPKGTWKISLQATDIESTLSSFNLDWTKNMVSAR